MARPLDLPASPGAMLPPPGLPGPCQAPCVTPLALRMPGLSSCCTSPVSLCACSPQPTTPGPLVSRFSSQPWHKLIPSFGARDCRWQSVTTKSKWSGHSLSIEHSAYPLGPSDTELSRPGPLTPCIFQRKDWPSASFRHVCLCPWKTCLLGVCTARVLGLAGSV